MPGKKIEKKDGVAYSEWEFPDRSEFGGACTFRAGTRFGRGCKFGDGCHFDGEARFDSGCELGAKSTVNSRSSFGHGCEIGAESRIRKKVVFGERCEIGERCTIEDDADVGRGCHFGDGCNLGYGFRCAESCKFGHGCRFRGNCRAGDLTVFGKRCQFNRKDSGFWRNGMRFGRTCTVGDGAVIHGTAMFDGRVTFGSGCTVCGQTVLAGQYSTLSAHVPVIDFRDPVCGLVLQGGDVQIMTPLFSGSPAEFIVWGRKERKDNITEDTPNSAVFFEACQRISEFMEYAAAEAAARVARDAEDRERQAVRRDEAMAANRAALARRLAEGLGVPARIVDDDGGEEEDEDLELEDDDEE
jgi:carbonic anhydrase/acetyltransferase-like protein (isoleucine patch superfamily)